MSTLWRFSRFVRQFRSTSWDTVNTLTVTDQYYITTIFTQEISLSTMNTIYAGYFFFLFQVLTSRIIDWDMVALIPLEVAIRLPTFLSKTPSLDKHGIVDDADRDLYIQEFRKCEVAKREITGTPLTNLLETSFSRTFFHEAFHSPSVHQKWFQEHDRKSAQRLLQELDDFCEVNSSNLKGLENELIKLREAIEGVNVMDKV
jgi:hypothetical protein